MKHKADSEDETAEHLLCMCPEEARIRYVYLENIYVKLKDFIKNYSWKKNYIKSDLDKPQ